MIQIQKKQSLINAVALVNGASGIDKEVMKAALDYRFNDDAGFFINQAVPGDLIGGGWSFVNGSGWQTTGVDGTFGPAVLMPLNRPCEVSILQRVQIVGSGGSTTFKVIIALLDAFGNIPYYVELADSSATVGELIATPYTNNGDNTFTAGTPIDLTSELGKYFDITMLMYCGCHRVTITPSSSPEQTLLFKTTPDANMRFTPAYSMVAIGNWGGAGTFPASNIVWQGSALYEFGFKHGDDV